MGAPFSIRKAGRDVQKTEIGAPDLFDGHGAGDPAVRHVIVRHMQGALLGKAVVRDDLERVLPRRHAAHDGGKGRIGIVVARDEGAVEIHLRRVTHALADDAQISLPRKAGGIAPLAAVIAETGIGLPAARHGHGTRRLLSAEGRERPEFFREFLLAADTVRLKCTDHILLP